MTWWLDRGRELLRSDITFIRSIEIPTSYRLEHGHVHPGAGRLHWAVTEEQVQAIWRSDTVAALRISAAVGLHVA